MNIGRASKASGVSAKMIRYYESVGLIPEAQRSDAGYRVYSDNDVHTLRFVLRSRDLGFSVKEISQLLELWQDRNRASADVKAFAQKHIDQLNGKIDELTSMVQTLEHLASNCQGNNRPECPILNELASEPGAD